MGFGNVQAQGLMNPLLDAASDLPHFIQHGFTQDYNHLGFGVLPLRFPDCFFVGIHGAPPCC